MNSRPFLLNDAIRGIIRRKYKVALFFCATLVLVGVVTLLTPKEYTSEARLFLRLGRENAALDATATLGDHPVVMMPQSREAEINSIVELLQSKNLYEAVVDQVGAERILKREQSEGGGESEPGLASSMIDGLMGWLVNIGALNDLPARERAVIKLKKDIEVASYERSNVIAIEYEGHSPKLAQDVVAALVDIYIQEHVRLHRPPGAYDFLLTETARISEELDERQAQLEAFKTKTGILSSAAQRDVLVQRIATLEANRLEVEAEVSALETEVAGLQDSLANVSATETMAEKVGAGNTGVDGMRQELFRLELAREELAAKFTPDHPRMRRIETEMNEARRILEQVEAGRVESVQGPNKVYQEGSVVLIQKRAALAAAKSRLNKLTEQVESLTEILDEFARNETKFDRLDRDVALLDATYRKYVANAEQAKIDQQMEEERFSNVGIAQAATLNLKPSRPNKVLNLLAALFLGIVGGCSLAVVLEYLNPTIRSEDDVAAYLGTSVLGTIPDLSASRAVVATEDDRSEQRAAKSTVAAK